MGHFDLIIVGGGPGGYEAAIRGSQLGLNVALIEKDKMGGTCLNRGCIPTKAFVHSADFLRNLKISRKLGIDTGELNIDIPKLVYNKDKIVRSLVSGVEYLMKKNKVTVFHCEAEFLDSGEVRAGEEVLSFDDLIIATGSSAAMPPVPGIETEGVMTATEILNIDHLPKELTIIGGGVIGCELACVFNEFGSRVTIVEMLDRLLPMIDSDVSDVLTYAMNTEGIRIVTGASVSSIQKSNGLFTVNAMTKDGGKSFTSDELLVAAGRKANTKGLECLGLRMEKGYICIDEHMHTNVPHIYAIGDVTGGLQLAHVASAQGAAAAENICGHNVVLDYSTIPNCIFTVPEIAVVGMTEEHAKKEGIDYSIGKFPMRASGRAMTLYETDGFTKLICEKTGGKVLGAEIIGPNATEMIGELAYIIRTGGTAEDIHQTIHAHPTVSETIREAAGIIIGKPMSI